MNSENENLPNLPDDELLDRAVATLRDAPIPDGPSPFLLDRTRYLMHQDSVASSHTRRLLRLHHVVRLAASVLIFVGLILAYRMAFHRPAPQIVQTPNDHPNPQPAPAHPEPAPQTPHVVQSTGNPVVIHDPTNPPALALADGVISGRVWYDGPAPKPVLASPEGKNGPIWDESLLVNKEGGVANVVVSVSSGLSSWLREEYPPPSEQAVLEQKDCIFTPHVVAVMVGQPLVVKNSDPFVQNVRLMAVNNPESNLDHSMKELATKPFESPEVFRVQCDSIPWMKGWVRVVDNPFFCVTTADGHFTIRGLPPGTYTLKAWHEQLGVREMQITLSPGKGSPTDFVFKAIPG